MVIRKFLLCLAMIFLACAGPGQFSSTKSWSEKILSQLSLREKISQMMVVSINMQFMNYESKRWKEIQNYIRTDGIGVLHIWFGDAGSSLTILNDMQQRLSLIHI